MQFLSIKVININNKKHELKLRVVAKLELSSQMFVKEMKDEGFGFG